MVLLPGVGPPGSSEEGRGGPGNLRLFLVAQAIFQSGTWVHLVGQTWLALELTGSGTALGWLATATFGPMLVLGPWTGVLADRVDRRHLLVVTHWLAAMQAAVLGALVLGGGISVPALYILALLHGLVYAVEHPVRRAFAAEVVPAAAVIRATSLASAVSAGSKLVGPAVAGVIMVGFGVGWAFVANAAASAVALIVLTRVRRADASAVDRLTVWRGQAGAGLRYVWGERELRIAMLLTATVTTLGFNHQVVIPVLAQRTFGGGAGAYTLLTSAMAAGAVLGALAGARRTTVDLASLQRAALAFGAAMVVAALSPNLAAAVGAAVLVGATGLWFVCGATSLLQVRAVQSMRGRVMALSAVVVLGAAPIGGPLVGWVCEQLSPRWGLLMGAAAALVAGGLRVGPSLTPEQEVTQ